MSYDYIKRMYGVHPIPGRTALHTETGDVVKILRERPSHGHYVRIRLPNGVAGFGHPTALDYGFSPRAATTQAPATGAAQVAPEVHQPIREASLPLVTPISEDD